MSQTSNRAHSAANATFVGLPTGSAIGIIFAALFTGAAIAAIQGAITWPLLALFAAAAVVSTTFVNPRGIFLTVASAPVLFAIALLAVGYFLGRDQLGDGGASGRAAQLLVVYPLIQLFPLLATVTVGAAAIGALRIWLIKRQNSVIQRREAAERSRAAESNRRTTTQGRRARERTGGIPVDELLKRERAAASNRGRRQGKPSGGSTRIASRLGDDLYSQE